MYSTLRGLFLNFNFWLTQNLYFGGRVQHFNWHAQNQARQLIFLSFWFASCSSCPLPHAVYNTLSLMQSPHCVMNTKTCYFCLVFWLLLFSFLLIIVPHYSLKFRPPICFSRETISVLIDRWRGKKGLQYDHSLLESIYELNPTGGF